MFVYDVRIGRLRMERLHELEKDFSLYLMTAFSMQDQLDSFVIKHIVMELYNSDIMIVSYDESWLFKLWNSVTTFFKKIFSYFLTINDTQIVGFFDPNTKRTYIILDENIKSVKSYNYYILSTILHEIVHRYSFIKSESFLEDSKYILHEFYSNFVKHLVINFNEDVDINIVTSAIEHIVFAILQSHVDILDRNFIKKQYYTFKLHIDIDDSTDRMIRRLYALPPFDYREVYAIWNNDKVRNAIYYAYQDTFHPKETFILAEMNETQYGQELVNASEVIAFIASGIIYHQITSHIFDITEIVRHSFLKGDD